MTKKKKPYELKKRIFAVLTRLLSLSIMKYYKPLNEDKLYIKLSIVTIMIIGTAITIYLMVNAIILLASLEIVSYLILVLVIFIVYMIVAVDKIKLEEEPLDDKKPE